MKIKLLMLVIVLILLFGCSFDLDKDINEEIVIEKNVEIENEEITEIKHKEIQQYFHYQLQNAKFDQLKKLDVKYLVIDIDDAELTKEQIKELQQQGKIVLSYLSIGEAEDYREYWQDGWEVGNPTFISEENPDWEGNYKVNFWEDEWQNIIFERVKEIASVGYGGVYLDIIDAYEYYAFMSSINTRVGMVNFVVKIAGEGKKINPNFLIIPQNAVELYESEKYKNVINGFGKEDTWFNDNEEKHSSEIKDDLKYLSEAVYDGKFVLSIDYPQDKEKVCEFYKLCSNEGFYCTISNRELDLKESILCVLS